MRVFGRCAAFIFQHVSRIRSINITREGRKVNPKNEKRWRKPLPYEVFSVSVQSDASDVSDNSRKNRVAGPTFFRINLDFSGFPVYIIWIYRNDSTNHS